MPRCVEHVEAQSFDLNAVAFSDPHGDHVGLGVLAHHGDAMGAVSKRAQPRDMVGVQMRIDGLDELEVELANKLQIAVDSLDDRVDDQRLAAMPAGEQISVGAGRAVEELAKDHRRFPHFDCTLYTGCGFAGIRSNRPAVLIGAGSPPV